MTTGLVPIALRDEAKYAPYTLDAFYGANALAKSVFTGKYAAPEDYWEGQPNLYRFWERLAWGAAMGELSPEEKADLPEFALISPVWSRVIVWYEGFLALVKDWRYVFGGRINFGLGREGAHNSLQNCFTVPILSDSMYGIYTALAQTGMTYARHGGVGNHLSILRPHGAYMRKSTMPAPGAVSFMDLLSSNTGTVAQEGRRGAQMQSLDIEHPDILRFIGIKDDGWPEALKQMARFSPDLAKKFNDTYGDRRRVSFSNISPHISDAFMEAVQADSTWDFWFPDIEACPKETDPELLAAWRARESGYTVQYDGFVLGSPEQTAELDKRQQNVTVYDTRWHGRFDDWKAAGLPIKVYQTVQAKAIFRQLCESAWRSGEPGVAYRGHVQRAWTSVIPYLTSNPCGEQNLAPYESCNLGHHNLASFVIQGPNGPELDFIAMAKQFKAAVRLQDNIHTVDKGRKALNEQEAIAQNLRRLGIGFTALADMLIMLGIRYDSDEALVLVETIMQLKNNVEHLASAELAAEKGACPLWDLTTFKAADGWDLLTSDVQAMIEKHGMRNVALSTVAPVGTGSLVSQSSGSGLEPLFKAKFERRVKQDDGSYKSFIVTDPLIERLFGKNPESLPDYVVEAHTVNLDKRIAMQALIGKYTDNAISSTINLPEDATVDDVEQVYLKAYALGLKGVTIYREGSRAGILRSLEDTTVEDGRTTARTPYELPALRILRKAEGKKWWFHLSLKAGAPYELFIDTNNVESNANTDSAVDALIAAARSHGVSEAFIAEQQAKASHQSNAKRLGRVLSLALRHGVSTDTIIDVLHTLPCYHAGSVVFHIAKVLASSIPDGTVAKGDCAGCNQSGTIRYENGCVTCHSCGYSKCG